MILNPVTGMIFWGSVVIAGFGALLYYLRKFFAEMFGIEVADEALDAVVDATGTVASIIISSASGND